ncbi:MAG: hypothetical protein RR327_05870 [Clostridia bacterium]
MKKTLDLIGGILAFLTVAMYGLLFIHHGIANFFPPVAVTFMESIKTLAVLVVCAITGLEFAMARKSFIIKLAFLILLGITVVAMFFPGALASIGIVF